MEACLEVAEEVFRTRVTSGDPNVGLGEGEAQWGTTSDTQGGFMNWWAIGNALGLTCQKQDFFIASAIVQGAEFVWDFSFLNKYKKNKTKYLALSD